LYLSLIIPAYNEAQRIGETLRHVAEYLAARPYASEVIVVDDGSADGTFQVVEAYLESQTPRVLLRRLAENQGKGAAVRIGMLELASGEYRFFYDADGSTPIEELDKCWPQFEAGADVVIGSRALPESDVQVHQVWYREQMGRMFNVLLRLFALTRFHDTQCGFKGFTAAAAAAVFSRMRVHRFSFDAEILLIAQFHGFRVSEIPVRWRNSPLSRVHPIHDSARMFLDLVGMRIRAALGKYR
jgi:dolichyl-phosphate beta-glucosyltransferase